MVELFAASAEIRLDGLAVVCLDGTPSSLVASIARGFREGRRAPVLYLHDSATVVYPFALEPLATLVRHRAEEPFVYRDLGLPPLGTSSRRFHDPSLPSDVPILALEAIPPATLQRYVIESARRVLAAPATPPRAEEAAARAAR
jgi:hypothetical protein